jgi:hypothetical protein
MQGLWGGLGTVSFVCLIQFGLPSNVKAEEQPSLRILVGAVPLSSAEEFFHAWRPTFETLLTEKVRKRLNTQISFSLVMLNLSSVFDAVANKEVDFVFANPSIYSCLDIEFTGKLAGNGSMCYLVSSNDPLCFQRLLLRHLKIRLATVNLPTSAAFSSRDGIIKKSTLSWI